MAGTRAGVIERDGVPVAGATVYVVDTVTNAMAGVATSDSDGHYSVDGLVTQRQYLESAEWESDGHWYTARARLFAVTDDEVTDVASVTLAPPTVTLDVGETQSLTATVRDADENLLTDRTVVFSSLHPLRATVTTGGVITALAAGVATIQAVCEGVAATMQVTVVAVVDTTVASVSVSPPTITGDIGETHQLTAIARNAADAALSGKTFAWRSDDTDVATVSGSGLVTFVSAGTAHIIAECEDVEGDSDITVEAVADTVVDAVLMDPEEAIIQVGGTRQITATPVNASSQALTGKVIVFASEDDDIASVSSFGLVTGESVGLIDITATSETKVGSSVIQVIANDVIGPQGQGIMGADPELIPIFYEAAELYDNDTQFRARFKYYPLDVIPTWVLEDPTKNGTSASGWAYNDGRYIDLVRHQTAVTILGKPAFEFDVLGHNLGSSAATPEIFAPITPTREIWLARRTMYPSTFTNYGDATSSGGIAFNATQAAAFKDGPWAFSNSPYSRAGLFSLYTTTLGHQSMSDYAGVGETLLGSDSVPRDGVPRDTLVRARLFNNAGVESTEIVAFMKPSASPNGAYAQVGPRSVHAYTGGTASWTNVVMSSLNYNMSRSTTIRWYASHFAVYNAGSGASPFGVTIV